MARCHLFFVLLRLVIIDSLVLLGHGYSILASAFSTSLCPSSVCLKCPFAYLLDRYLSLESRGWPPQLVYIKVTQTFFSSKIAQVWNEGVGVSLGPSSFQPSESGPPWLIYAHRDTTRFTERTEMHTTGSLKIDAACQALSHVLGHHSFDTTEDTMTSTAARLLTFIDNPYSGLLRAHSLQRLIYLKICDLYPNLFLVSAKEFPKIKCRFCFSNTDQALCMC